tara:strand:+ start:561 stop:1229 length:669 start_codon:yes stop_codon:yes gene_type:complete
MKLIPAIDLKNNKVVIPYGNSRSDYKEIPKDKSPTSDPIKFIDFLLSIYNFNTIYIADLDSIESFKENNGLIKEILCKFNNLEFIIDNGARKFSQINFIDKNMTQIIGTETFVEYEKLHKSNFKNFILSLDIKDGNVLCKNSNYNLLSPAKTICMNLDNIGKDYGINKINIKKIHNLYTNTEIIYSGGIRNHKDVLELKNFGINEVILLSSILDKKIDYKIL